MNALSAALDFSGSEAGFSVAERASGKVFFEVYREMKGRDSSMLLPWILESLAAHNVDIHGISEWTAGNGPGSFSGLRIVAALIAGLSFGHEGVKTRGMSSAAAIASAIGLKDGESAAVFFDGRNNELFFYGIKNKSSVFVSDGRTEILSAGALSLCDFGTYAAFCGLKHEEAAMGKLLPAEIMNKVQLLDHLPVSKLIFNDPENWSDKITELNYIRPATLALPINIKH